VCKCDDRHGAGAGAVVQSSIDNVGKTQIRFGNDNKKTKGENKKPQSKKVRECNVQRLEISDGR